MTLDMLRAELDHEAKTTRKLVERVPDDRLDWKPHARSFSLGGLASHIVDCFQWGDAILNGDEYDFDPATHRSHQATSAVDLVARLDSLAARCREALARADEERMLMPWRLKIRGRQRFERPRVVVLRDFTLSHLIHHRGQLSVYLRLLDVPVPGAYGPSADDA